jgi:hypothetical protein
MSQDSKDPLTDHRPNRREYTLLGVLLVLGLVVRIVFHPQAIEPMHRVVVWPALQVLEGEFHPNCFADFRYGLIYPAAFSFCLFGVSLASFSLYPLLCSMGSLLLAYAIGKRVGGPAVGLVALLVLAVWPLEIYIAGRGEWPDGPQAFFASLGLYLLLVARDRETTRPRIVFGLLAGVALGLSCLVKVTTLFLLPAIIIYAVCDRRVRLASLALLGGMAAPFLTEVAVDYHLTGDPLARVKCMAELSGSAGGGGNAGRYGYSVWQLSAYPKKFFVQPLMYGLHMYAAVGAVVYVWVRWSTCSFVVPRAPCCCCSGPAGSSAGSG